MDFFTKQNVQLNDNTLSTAAMQNDEDKILLLMSQHSYCHEETSHIVQLKTIPLSSKLCILYGAIQNDDFDLIKIILKSPVILSHIHHYKNNAIFTLIKSQASCSFYKDKYTLLTKKLARIPGVANELAKQHIADFYASSEQNRKEKVTSLKKVIFPLSSIDKNAVLLNAAAHSQLEIITVLLKHYDDEIVGMNKFKAFSYAKIKKNPECIAYLEKSIHQNLIILPKKILSFISLLKQKDGFLLNYNKLSPIFRNESFTKIKHNPHLAHSIIKSSNGALFALYREGIIGTGAYGKVKLAQNIKTGQICVVKVEQKSNGNIPELPSVEVEILKLCDLFIDYQENKNHLKDQIKGYIFIKYIPGCTLSDLSQILRIFGIKLNTLEQCLLLQSLLKSVKKLKKNNISHNDLHSNNLMINPSTMQATIIDFGKSCIDLDADINIELSRIDSILCNVISNAELKQILNSLSSLTQKELVLKGLHDTIDTLDSLIQQCLLHTDELISPFAAFIKKDLDVMVQLEQLNKPLSTSQPLLLSKTYPPKKRKRENKELPLLSLNEFVITEEEPSADEPKVKPKIVGETLR